MYDLDYSKALIFKKLRLFNDNSLANSKIFLLDKVYGINLGYNYRFDKGTLSTLKIIEDINRLKDFNIDDVELVGHVADKVKNINVIEDIVGEGSFKAYMDRSKMDIKALYETLALVVEVSSNFDFYTLDGDLNSLNDVVDTCLYILDNRVTRDDVKFAIEVLVFITTPGLSGPGFQYLN